ncbi:hypothetical protein FKG95_14785 [Denitrobaculum tricleocarpae]|uniref:SH3 domain-containing protein n=2 Tax=Denitrobaculum tricleocarpae TaxID=2591009 RepID=A0A545TRT2_9PROT|nr:hypothetical protein FKG95_14785 [Denitrobaculum tricleocarpae]
MVLFPVKTLRNVLALLTFSALLTSGVSALSFSTIAGLTVSAARAEAQTPKIGKSGLPLPRYVSLAKPKVNLRKGPGLRYPIEWVYRRDRLPVEIIAEFDTWRQIRDWEGTVGWVHRNMLRGRRTVMIKDGTQVLRAGPEDNAQPLLQAEAGVIGRLVDCEGAWCRVEIAGTSGWLRSRDFFGAATSEDVN